MNLKKFHKKIDIKIILGISGVILCYGFTMALFTYTMVDPLMIILISLGIAMASAFPIVLIRNNENRKKTVIIKLGCYIIAMTGLFMSMILGINYFARKKSETYTYNANIEKIISETAHRSKRVGRRYYNTGQPYKKYYVIITMPDGKSKKYPISTETYNKYASVSHIHKRRPRNVEISITPGAFGWHVIGPVKL